MSKSINSLTPTAPIIAASYKRVSTKPRGQYRYSLGGQHRTLEQFAADNGWRLLDGLQFRDGETENASGSDWDLPGLTAMLEAAERREFSVLAVYDLDRFARSLVKGLVLEEQLQKYGVRVVYQRVPVDNTPEGDLQKHQLFSFAEYEKAKIRLRLLMEKRHKATAGHVVGGGEAPYGYRYTRVKLANGKVRVIGLKPDPKTAPIAQRILESLVTHSAAEIADMLNAEGIPAPRAGRKRVGRKQNPGEITVNSDRWASTTVFRLGVNTVYSVSGSTGRIATESIPTTMPESGFASKG